MKQRLFVCFTVIFLIILQIGQAWGDEESIPSLLALKSTIDRILEIQSDESLKRPERAQERRQLLETEIAKRFNCQSLSWQVLGYEWQSKITEAHQKEFFELFMKFFAHTFVEHWDRIYVDQIQYTSIFEKADTIGKIKVAGWLRKARIPMAEYEFGLKNYTNILPNIKRQKTCKFEEGWQVAKIKVDGMNYFEDMNKQFIGIINSSSFEELLKKLRARVKRFEDTNP